VNETLRERDRLGVIENMVLRRIFGPRRDEVSGLEREYSPKDPSR
jgi:hypothetical protein